MTDLHEKSCIPCRGGVPPFDISEIHKYLKKVDGWDVKKKENAAVSNIKEKLKKNEEKERKKQKEIRINGYNLSDTNNI